MILKKKYRSTERKAAKPQPLTIYLPKIPHGVDGNRILASEMMTDRQTDRQTDRHGLMVNVRDVKTRVLQ